MHDTGTLKKLNDDAAAKSVPKSDVRIIRYQDGFVAIPQTPAGSRFVEEHYGHEQATLGGRVLTSEDRMVLLADRATAYGVTVADYQ
jgi:hypothetical protein